MKVYLDNHTVTRPAASVSEAFLPFLKEQWGSLVAPHQKGQELFAPWKRAEGTILEQLGAKGEDRFYFFSSSQNALSHLLLSHYFDTIRHTGKNHILTVAGEEITSSHALQRLEELGCVRKILPVNEQGQLTQEILEKALGPRVSLVSFSWASGLTGVIQPLADLAAVCRAKGILLHVDVSSVIGKLFFRFEDLPVDFLTFDGSLFHAPKGVAGMLVKEKTLFSPFSETSVGGIPALAEALKGAEEGLDHLSLETARLRDKLERGIKRGFPEAQVLFEKAERLPNVSAIAIPGIATDALLFLLHRKRVYASAGGEWRLGELLIAKGIEPKLAQCALSFNLSFETTEEEIDYAIDAVLSCIEQLRPLSSQIEGIS